MGRLLRYIGGDPCGSKYNNDPFAADVQKPGMPDDMKARIADWKNKTRKRRRSRWLQYGWRN
jgi:hypothetical protein